MGAQAAADEPIDAVCLWVDGADVAFQEALQLWLPTAGTPAAATAAKRFRDNGELRYSLRSLQRHASWIRRIYVVTNGQKPKWLDQSHPKVRIVPHTELFPRKTDLPTFNSNAVEMHLHRIPRLSRRFLYLNDDVFLGAPTPPSLFLHPDGSPRPLFQRTPVHADTAKGSVHDRAYAYSQQASVETWRPDPIRFLPAHAPQLYDREIIAEIERAIPAEFAETSMHRFRSPDDLVLRIVHTRQVQAAGSAPEEPTVLRDNSEEYCFVRIRFSFWDGVRRLLRIARMRPRFFCLNDDVADAIGPRILLRLLPLFLWAMFPRRADWERRA